MKLNHVRFINTINFRTHNSNANMARSSVDAKEADLTLVSFGELGTFVAIDTTTLVPLTNVSQFTAAETTDLLPAKKLGRPAKE